MNHPIHPMLVHFPIAFWTFATIGDLLSFITGDRFVEITVYMLMIGIITALIAMFAGLFEIDKIAENSSASNVVNKHLSFATLTCGLYALSLYLRFDGLPGFTRPDILEISLSVAGFISLCITGLFGGKLVYRYGIGVEK